MRNECSMEALDFCMMEKKTKGAEFLNLSEFNENFAWDDFGSLHKLLGPHGGELAGVSEDTSRHESENHLGKNTPVENDYHGSKVDLLDYDWSEIANFQENDIIFRNHGFDGQRHWEIADELSWFSTSSESLFGSGISLESGLQSTCTKTSKLNNTSELHDGSVNNFSKNYTSTISRHVPSSSVSQVSFRNCKLAPNEQVEKQYSTEETSAEQLEFYKLLHSNGSNFESCPPYKFSKQNKDVAMKMHALHPSVEEKSSIPPMFKGSFRQPTSTVIQSSNYHFSTCRVQPTYFPVSLSIPDNCSSVAIENSDQHYNQASSGSVRKTNVCYVETESRNGKATKSFDISEGVNGSSMSVDASSLNVSASGNQIHEISFKELQNVLDQLDGRTKLCIKDGLYRLARNAKQRHIISQENASSNEYNFKSAAQSTDSSECSEKGDMETDTNPIDRSIAHLLFHRPLEHSSKFYK